MMVLATLCRGCIVFALLLLMEVGLGFGQSEVASGTTNDGLMTLHAYVDLVQIPVLVLTPQRKPMRSFDPRKIVVSLNSGRPFAPSHVRLEGDDPLTVAILVDTHEGDNELLPGLADAIDSLVPTSLRPQDTVAVYGINCGLVRYARSRSAEGDWLRHAVEDAAAHKGEKPIRAIEAPRSPGDCEHYAHLWNSMAYLVKELSTLPGRRVILAVSKGGDGGSPMEWPDLRIYATSQGVTIFGLAPSDGNRNLVKEARETLAAVSELSGGLTMRSSASELPEVLKGFVGMLRGRYIIDFPRPVSSEPGRIDILVSLAKQSAFVRSSGISFPIADPKLRTDPNTVPSDPTRAPEIGSRRVLKAQ
ncbi:vWA domain-containing protein [Granulicella arctica]|uniref:hypothetical protein n=1 Tax=Granulicella arctica TaxID=940613 RepID=UPI0021E04CEB|nr:hypothetical protein [Granulicella arctica]